MVLRRLRARRGGARSGDLRDFLRLLAAKKGVPRRKSSRNEAGGGSGRDFGKLLPRGSGNFLLLFRV
jgi:hypothetical protein